MLVYKIQSSKCIVCLVSSIVLNLFLILNLYVGNYKWKPSWSTRAAEEAEAVAALTCSGHGRAFLDGIVVRGKPVCECNTCFEGPDCSQSSPSCAANVDSGDPLFLEPFWMQHAASSAIVVSGWNRMTYGYSDYSSISQELERHIRKLHTVVGNAVTTGRFIVFGPGSTVLLNAAVHALSPHNSSTPARVTATIPYYPDRFHFDIPKMEPWLIAKMNSIWVRVKCNIKKKHFSPGATVHAQYSKCPADFPPHQWKALVEYWRTAKAEKMSAQSIANRQKVKVVHRLGTDSYATKRAKMTMDNGGVEPSDFDLFIETHKEKENKQLDSSAKALLETMSQIPAGTPEDSAREQALKAITGGPSHGRIPLLGLLPPSMVVLKQKAALADSAMAEIEKAKRDSELAKRDAADSQVQVQILKERIDAMERAQKERDAGVNAFIKKYNLMDTDALACEDSDATQGEYDVDSVQPT